MQKPSGFLICVVGLVSCGGNDTPPNVSVYKYFGSVQCGGGGVSLAELERQLTNAGVRVLASACGFDGNAHPTVCGAPDGAIGIFDIPAAQTEIASGLSFSPLSHLTAASMVPCK